MPDVAFTSEGTTFKLPNPKKTSQWLRAIAKGQGRDIESLHYVFSSDSLVGELNAKYLHHNTLTDIITFDYSESGGIVGEIYISIPRVRDNSRVYSQPFATELRRVMAHGLLHILGFKDKTAAQKAQMRRKEEACLSLWP